MKWRVMVELTGSDGIVRSHEVSVDGSNTSECSAGTVGLALADGKPTLAGLQDHLGRAQAEEHCRRRRGCSHCGSRWPSASAHAARAAYRDTMPETGQKPASGAFGGRASSEAGDKADLVATVIKPLIVDWPAPDAV